VLPFMSEQEANGALFVEAHNAGFLLRHTSRARDGRRHFTYRLRYSGESASGDCGTDEWRQAVQDVLADSSYAQGAKRISKAIRAVTDQRDLPRTITEFLA
jgi:hypothetical protein